MLKTSIHKHKKSILLTSVGLMAGSLAGFFYWKFVGCNSGTCAIRSNPTKSTLYGAMLGALLVLSFTPDSSKVKEK